MHSKELIGLAYARATEQSTPSDGYGIPRSHTIERNDRCFFLIAKFSGMRSCVDCAHVRIKSAGGVDNEVAKTCKHCTGELLLLLSRSMLAVIRKSKATSYVNTIKAI